MLILAAIALALLVVPLVGGQLSRLALLRLRQQRLVVAALGLQVLAVSIVPTWPRPLLVAAHGASYVLAGVFVWLNRRVPGLWLLAAGAAMNAVTIAVNGGMLPADPDALRAAGQSTPAGEFINSGAVANPHLAFFGDNYASPAWLPLQNVYSIGDLLIFLGAAYAIHRTCRRRRPRRGAFPAQLSMATGDS